ncbi:unnamed protein product [Prorocentrum cordatum]|uniref:Uncharacterized protein n=1 Tax=Prorocentrum cordatum TaxID=2364126 RepID=A0ABN9PXR5_9DINO|nr:unnamed protein product [Polarella glacialis]
MESSWAPKTRIGAPARAGEVEAEGCQDLQPGSVCYNAVTWLRTQGIKKHPAWYPEVTADSIQEEVQERLHSLGRGDCPKPCQRGAGELLAGRDRAGYQRVQLADGDKVLEVTVEGRQVVSEAYRIPEPASCADTVEGEWCHTSILWLKSTGLAKHPKWYPELTQKSSIADFQAVLHKQHKMSCPRPCRGQERNATAGSQDEQGPSTTTYPFRAHTTSCEHAEEASHCYRAITKVMDFDFWRHPEAYPGLTNHSSRDDIQEHLYQRGDNVCGWPCPRQIKETRRVLKRVSDMTPDELSRFMDKSWDGYVDSDQYDEYEPVQTIDKRPPATEEQEPDANESAPEQEEEEVAHRHLAIVKSTKSRLAADGLADECRDTRVGELCYEAVTWAQEVGIHDRPNWYPGLSLKSTFMDFQEFLHKTKGSLCEMPCGTSKDAARVADADAARASDAAAGPDADADGEIADAYEEKWESEREGRRRPPPMAPVPAPAAEEAEAAAEGAESTSEVAAPEEANSTAEESGRPSAPRRGRPRRSPPRRCRRRASPRRRRRRRPMPRGSCRSRPTRREPTDSRRTPPRRRWRRRPMRRGSCRSWLTRRGPTRSRRTSTRNRCRTSTRGGRRHERRTHPHPQEAQGAAEEALPSASADAEEGPAPQPEAATVQAGAAAEQAAEQPAGGLYAEANATETQRLRDEHAQLMEEHARLQEEHTRLKEVLEAKRLKEEHERLKEEHERLKAERAQSDAAAVPAPEPESAAVEAEAGTSDDPLPEIDWHGREEEAQGTAPAAMQNAEGQDSTSDAQPAAQTLSDAAAAEELAPQPLSDAAAAAELAEPGTSEVLLPEIDMGGQESESPFLVMEPANQTVAAAEEVNSTAGEPPAQLADARQDA